MNTTKPKKTRRTTAEVQVFKVPREPGSPMRPGQVYAGDLSRYTNGEYEVMIMFKKHRGRGASFKAIPMPTRKAAEDFVASLGGVFEHENRVLRPLNPGVES